ncbi:uncharacterized protein K441DRAFT_553288, partial [Cenococcum geophilum 1.58]|uniref:uncharacterized protein n=1 Tax=Cenococcum geophilum 1.58 TaxID=794803 RepID=UPI003590264A
GQIIAANSYQITLLTGEDGQVAVKLYVVALIYLVASLFWWLLFRKLKSIYVLALPFLFYGVAFFVVGIAPYTQSLGARGWIYNIATGFYAFASASGSFFFTLNFGTEGKATRSKTWALRACLIQGTQQIYVALLWYWGSSLTRLSTAGIRASSLLTSTRTITAITTPIAVFLWAVGLILFFGLPKYYRQTPGKVPSFYTALLHRKVVLWFFVMVLIQNYWLSAPYGRNWRYLWSSQHAPIWAVVLLLLFFIVIWALALFILGILSKRHSWILPIFAIGLGAPRWAQILWATSNIGLYVPLGSRVTGALLGRCLWLWLGVLDALQGVGFGMILLQTLTRFHVAFTLVAAQVIGSVATILAKATAPNSTSLVAVFPNFALGLESGLRKPWFWVTLILQLLICAGYFKVFRKEQLFKP